LASDGNAFSGAGVIETNSDVDTFAFMVSAADTYRMAANVAAIAPNLDIVLEFRSGGQLLEIAAPQATVNAAIVRHLQPGTYTVAVKSSGVYGWVGQYSVSIDTPPAEIIVTPAMAAMTTYEDGRAASFTVMLGTQPASEVLIPISSTNIAEGSLSATSLVFTAANWNVPQTVTITGVGDGIIDGDVAYSVVIGAAMSTDSEYSGLDPADLGIANVDNDAAGFIYRVDNATDTIERARLSGSQPEVIVDLKTALGSSGDFSPYGIAADVEGGKLYWIDGTTDAIYRANLDGSQVETVLSLPSGMPRNLALDTTAGKMYWIDTTLQTIRRANLDGSMIEDLLTGAGSVNGIALDIALGQMYWTESTGRTVRRANLNGTSAEILWNGTSTPSGIAVDAAAGKLYWAVGGSQILRANLDASNVEVVVQGAPRGFALDSAGGKIYWQEFATKTVYRANLDGTMVVPLTAGQSSFGMAIVHPTHGVSVTSRTGLVTTEAGGTATFRIALNTRPSADVVIPIASSDPGEGVVSASSITFTPDNWNVAQTITVIGVDDAVADGDMPYTIVVGTTASLDPRYNGLDPSDAQLVNVDDDVLTTKFYVVNDATTNRTYEYGADGAAIENYSLNSGNSTPRGAASTAAGDKVWVVDANRKVFVYDAAGALLGSWTAGSLASSATVHGIATNGTDIWIVDAKSDKVFRYTGAASRLSGSQNAASSFSLNSGNRDPSDLVTNGTYLWVTNNSSTDKVFKYTVAGALAGSWTISGGGGSPTGITIDPTGGTSIWIVDSNTDRVYRFDNATSRTSGSAAPAASFALAAGNTNPQGIADPPAMLVQPSVSTTILPTLADHLFAANYSSQGAAGEEFMPNRLELPLPRLARRPALESIEQGIDELARWYAHLADDDSGSRPSPRRAELDGEVDATTIPALLHRDES
jgi:hypothetical protein